METIKQHKLLQERDALLEKNEQLKAELQVIIDKSIHDEDNYSFSDDERGEQIGREIAFNARKIEEINRKLEMYEVFGDCFDKFYERLKAEYHIKQKTKTVIRGKDLLAEFEAREKAKEHEYKAPRH